MPAPDWRVDLSRLAFCLAEAGRRGYLTQFTIVRATSVRRVFRSPSSTWRIGDRSGRGRVVLL